MVVFGKIRFERFGSSSCFVDGVGRLWWAFVVEEKDFWNFGEKWRKVED